MSRYYVFDREADALALCAAVDAACGYPRCHCADCGGTTLGGPPPACGACVTECHAMPRAHPDGARWAVVADAATAPHAGGREAVALDASWFPSDPA